MGLTLTPRSTSLPPLDTTTTDGPERLQSCNSSTAVRIRRAERPGRGARLPTDPETVEPPSDTTPVQYTGCTYFSACTTCYILHTTYYILHTTYYLQLTAHYPLLTIYYSLLTTHYSLPTPHYPLPTTQYLLAQHSSLFTPHYPLPTTQYLLTQHFSLFTPHYLLRTIYYHLLPLTIYYPRLTPNSKLLTAPTHRPQHTASPQRTGRDS